MKKYLCFFMAVLMLLCSLNACSDLDKELLQGYDPYPYDDLSVFMDMPELKDLSVKESDIEDYINSDISNMLESQGLYKQVYDGTAQKWHKAVIDYVGTMYDEKTKEDVVFDGGTGYNYNLILGSNTFVPGFEDGVIGMSIGDTKRITFNFPEKYYEDLAGKEVTFTVTLKSLYVFPEITDDFCKNYTFCKTVDEFRSALRTEYIENYAFDTLLERCTLKSKPAEYKAYYESFVEYFEGCAAQYGLSVESFLAKYGHQFSSLGLYRGMTLEEFYTAAEEHAEINTLNDLLMYSTIRNLELKTEGERYKQAKKRLMSTYDDLTFEELIEKEGKASVITSIMYIQTKTALAEYVKVTK